MSDKTVQLGESIIQHGPYNNRIYLMKLSPVDFPEILDRLDKLAQDKGYSKIFAKIPPYARDTFMEKGYVQEAAVPRFYNLQDTAFFAAKYLSTERMQENDQDRVDNVLKAAKNHIVQKAPRTMHEGYTLRVCQRMDTFNMAKLYKQVFETYPFPIHDPAYLEKTMTDNIIYFGIWQGTQLAALSSAEADVPGQNAEMTDFAVLPEHRGQNLSNILLDNMEKTMISMGIPTTYTIARAYSYGMNAAFAKAGYTYTGTLVNNTNISGRLESMNVWYKHGCLQYC